MLLITLIIAFSVLALGLLALLDRYESAADKAQAKHWIHAARKQVYYDAFSTSTRPNRDAQPVVNPEHGRTAA